MHRSRPVVVSILTINQAQLLRDCLESLFAHPPRVPFRVHVFDQASTDETPAVLAEFRRRYPDLLDVHRHPENIGFVRANNIVFRKYPDHDVVVLNDDTVLLPGWLDALRERVESDPRIGVVGARLVYPNGVLQEAGGEVFRDALGQNIGKWDDPARPIYLRAMDVDYCSGACLYIRREVLDATGGFDERFAPAYYEDSDLCFQARKLGWRVVYEPASVIIHREGATNGVDLRQGVKRWQAVNRERFLEKWRDELASHRRGTWHNPPAPGKKSILFIHEMPPLVDQAAGDVRLFELLAGLARRGHAATLLAVDGRGGKERYADMLRARGVMVAPNDWPRWPIFGLGGDPPPRSCTLEQLFRENDFDLVVIEFYRVARVYLPLVRRLAPDVPIVTDSVDVHFLRERREAEVLGDPWLALRAERTREVELALYEMSDGVLTVTDDDTRTLLEEGLETPVTRVSHPVRVPDRTPSREERDGLFFIGNFRHPPNADGITWFVREAWPLVRERVPDAVLRIGGSAMPPEVRALEGNGVEIRGFVPDVDELRDRSLVAVAPLRFGAGVKGKNLESMVRGLPTVTTSIGAEGMGATPGEHLLVADDPRDFAEAVVRLLVDADLWHRVAAAGKEFVASRWGLEAILDRAEGLLLDPPARRPFPPRTALEIDLAQPAAPCPAVPGVLGVVLTAPDGPRAALALERIREVHGGDVDAIVLFDGRDREAWHEHAFLGRYRLAVPREQDLARVLRAAAAHLAGKRVLYLDARYALFDHVLESLERALDDAPGEAVHATAVPAAPGPDGREPWELAAARTRESGATEPAEILLARRDDLLAGIEVARTVPGAVVVDPAASPEIRVAERRDPARLLVAVLGDGAEERRAWERVAAEPGAEVAHIGPSEDTGARLGELAAASRAAHLLVVSGASRPVLPFWPRLSVLARTHAHPAALLYTVPPAGALPWPGEYHLGTRLPLDVPGLPGMLYMTMPAVLFLEPRPESFEEGTRGATALWRAWQRHGCHEPEAALHDETRHFLERQPWPDGAEILAEGRRAAVDLRETLHRTDLLPAWRLLAAGAPWWELPPRAKELVDEMVELRRSHGQRGPEVTWDRGPIDPLLLWFQVQVETAPGFRDVVLARLEPEAVERWRKETGVGGQEWRRGLLAETLAASYRVLAAAGRRELARERIREALALAPRNPVVLAIAAEDALAAGRTDEALATLATMRTSLVRETLPGLWPRGHLAARSLLLEAVLLARARRDEEVLQALDYLEEWRLRPGGLLGRRLLEVRAEALERLGRHDEARLARVSAIALAPGVTDRPVPGQGDRSLREPAGLRARTTAPAPA